MSLFVCLYLFICLNADIHICCMHVDILVCRQTRVNVCVYLCLYMYMFVHMYVARHAWVYACYLHVNMYGYM